MHETSRQAHKSIDAATLRGKIRQWISQQADGATCDEVEQQLRMRHQTASARIRELYRAGDLRDSGKRRPTRSGRPAIVWVLAPPSRCELCWNYPSLWVTDKFSMRVSCRVCGRFIGYRNGRAS